MFRELARKNKQLPMEECIEILKSETRGVLCVCGDDGYPYGMPMNHWYNEEDGKIYFHSGKKGHKVDAISRENKVSFCVFDGGYRNEGEWALNISSVIVFGKMRVIEDVDQTVDICRRLSLKFTDNLDYIEKEIASFAKATLCFELTPEHITGKLVNEA